MWCTLHTCTVCLYYAHFGEDNISLPIQRWLRCNFSLQYPYIIQQTGNENAQSYQIKIVIEFQSVSGENRLTFSWGYSLYTTPHSLHQFTWKSIAANRDNFYLCIKISRVYSQWLDSMPSSFVNTSSVTFNLSSSVVVLEPYLHLSFTKVEDNRSQVQSQKGILWIASS